jgi:monovalent cation:proton antiporter-2 (CPA2) family protein
VYQDLFIQAFIYIAAAVVAVPVAKRLGLGSALGYLLAGVIIGPFVLGLVGEHGEDVMHFAEWGVVLMLFLVGLELEPATLWRMRVPIIGMGGLQVGLTALGFSLMAVLTGFEWRMALAIGLTLSLSSTAMVLQTMEEKGWMKTAAGRSSFSVLLFQDVAVIPILAIMPLLAMPGLVESGDVSGARPGWLQTLLVFGAVAGIVLAGRYLCRPLFHYIARTRSHEMFIATSLLMIVGITLAMNYVGLSPALGTFLAGVVLAESEFRHELESNIEPFKGLLLGLFFISVGAAIDFGLLRNEWVRVLSLLAVLVVFKFSILFLLGRFFGLARADRLLFSFALAQGGEFAFLLVSFALQSRVFPTDTANLLILVVVLSMVFTPVLIIIFEKILQPRLVGSCEGEEPEEEDMDDPDNPVIIAGFGRFGQIVGRLLNAAGYETTLLDHDAGQIEMVGRFGNKVFYGDASRTELLRSAGAARAKILVVAIDDQDKAVRMVEATRQAFPHLKILARSIDRPHTYELIRAGVDFFARETFGSALATGEEALRLLGVTDERARRMASTFEKHDTEGLYKLYDVWGDDEAYGFRLGKNVEELAKVLQDDAEAIEQSGQETGGQSPEGNSGSV